ncbi:MAG: response regulator transcription factor [Clostridia bacterium]|nr:response regulator transcription factor [Clostridia bacterium]
MKKIFVIDDDVYIGDMLETALTEAGYEVLRAYSGTEALLVLEKNMPDLVLLDLMLPGLSGEELLPRIKGIPVIVVSAKVGIDDKVNLLLGGASDYITKPFEIKELLARITIHLRSTSEMTNTDILRFDNIAINTLSHEVCVNEVAVHLTKTEFAILKVLLINGNQAIAKSVLLDNISLETPDCTESSLKQHVSNLRKKLRDADGKEHIEAVWGIGFKLTE